ncbi:hypothetical protein PRIPAC_77406 [Pristionchus pacificus]|uniref:Uncharacterized protein n=1 Tax=Pristionchus pacificus TaxID=54126 RepID=A0A2A6BI28_PRIPA|nr:hypothetical protein PRIPAC_77406 [Pristionchus pacificus]|eukprot:PDM65554.1 hypothetical protein PRIPAC_52496 [Pristionchus pacificus]
MRSLSLIALLLFIMVALKSIHGYITHWFFGRATSADEAKEWEMLTPVKNDDGSWSFKSRYGKWLSASNQIDGFIYVTFVSKNNLCKVCEDWRLDSW